jgi:hypothetical protein
VAESQSASRIMLFSFSDVAAFLGVHTSFGAVGRLAGQRYLSSVPGRRLSGGIILDGTGRGGIRDARGLAVTYHLNRRGLRQKRDCLAPDITSLRGRQRSCQRKFFCTASIGRRHSGDSCPLGPRLALEFEPQMNDQCRDNDRAADDGASRRHFGMDEPDPYRT